MRTSTRVFEKNALALLHLDAEHSEIRRRYTGLEKAILSGTGMPCILATAKNLVQIMLLHFIHEEQFLAELSLVNIQNRHSDANIEITAQLFSIEAELEQGKTATLFQLLLLGRAWMKEHMQLEGEEFECDGLIEGEKPFLVPRSHPAENTGNTGEHNRLSHRLQHAHLQGQRSPQPAPKLNG